MYGSLWFTWFLLVTFAAPTIGFLRRRKRWMIMAKIFFTEVLQRDAFVVHAFSCGSRPACACCFANIHAKITKLCGNICALKRQTFVQNYFIYINQMAPSDRRAAMYMHGPD